MIDDRRVIERTPHDTMGAYGEYHACRWNSWLEYFGEPAPDRCGHCDNDELTAASPTRLTLPAHFPRKSHRHPVFGRATSSGTPDQDSHCFDSAATKSLDLGLVRDGDLLEQVDEIGGMREMVDRVVGVEPLGRSAGRGHAQTFEHARLARSPFTRPGGLSSRDPGVVGKRPGPPFTLDLRILGAPGPLFVRTSAMPRRGGPGHQATTGGSAAAPLAVRSRLAAGGELRPVRCLRRERTRVQRGGWAAWRGGGHRRGGARRGRNAQRPSQAATVTSALRRSAGSAGRSSPSRGEPGPDGKRARRAPPVVAW